ncbi:DUF418 domain-containing protein [Bacillus cereus]|uniref:DUF418 domain-containing protein n=1 Tax=Bacillus cereus TaxID=1396 RepID=UPI00362A84FB
MIKSVTNNRIDELDYIRGFALLGIILVNILAILSLDIPKQNTMDASYQRFLYLFVEGRFFTIFSFLFGIGFYIFLTRAIAKGQNGYILFLRRLAALLVFGIIHTLYQSGEALKIYAVCGLLILPFYKVKKEINLVLGVILTIYFASTGAKSALPIALILLGLSAGQYRLFENLSGKMKQVAIFTCIMFILSVVGVYYQYKHVPLLPFDTMLVYGEDGSAIGQNGKFLEIGIAIGPILSAFYVGLLILLLQTKVLRALLAPLKYYGRMALTNYVGQTAMILLASSVLHLRETMTYMQSLYVCISIYVFQIIFSFIWMKFFKLGPLEWIWRMITYKKVMPIKK